MPSPLRIAGFTHAMVEHGPDGGARAGVDPRLHDRRVRTVAAVWPMVPALHRRGA